MIRLVYTLWLARELFREPFPRTRRAIQAAQKRVQAAKAARRAGTWE